MRSIATCIVLALLLVACTNAACTEVEFTYSDQAGWGSLDGSVCDGTRQSPIDILTARLADGKNFGLDQLYMTNWNVRTTGTWSNNGHTVQYTPEDAAAVTTETHLGVYNLVQLHFHWGPNGSVGSEHLVDGASYSGELHFVHRKAVAPNDLGNAYTVVGVLLQANSLMDISGTVWEQFATTIPGYDESTTLSGIVLNDMVPTNLSYYYYDGSLTTPLCNEVVQWALLRYPVSVPAAFFDSLRMTPQDSNGTPLKTNHRYVQSLNGRQVYSYTTEPFTDSGCWLL